VGSITGAILAVIVAAALGGTRQPDVAPPEPEYCVTEYEEPLDVDPPPVTEYVAPPEFPSAAQLKLIGRLSEGIYKNRTHKGETHPYWFCGEPHRGEPAKALAVEVAWHIVRSAWKASDERYEINVWMWAGLINNESGFDPCAFGTNPRTVAYRIGVLKRRRLTVSHTREQVIEAITNPRMKSLFRAFDLGMGQTLDVYYLKWLAREGLEGEPADLLEWKGFYWQAQYMHSLAIERRTKRPWMFWPGYRAKWKHAKVKLFARGLGARRDEL
jgi:hypothetical protein